MITEQIKDSIGKIFEEGDVERGKKLAEFEESYKRSFGVFFTGFTINIEEKYGKILEILRVFML